MPERITHTLAPVFDTDSHVLILGTMPSPRSRKEGFYYGHPQNRFWRVMADVFSEDVPSDNQSKAAFLLRHHIALWDVLASCRIEGAGDNSISDPVPNDLSMVLGGADIRYIFTTGRKASQLYRKYCFPLTGIDSAYLPSTSPANCAGFSYSDLVSAYKVIADLI